jgi:hypothetical protein
LLIRCLMFTGCLTALFTPFRNAGIDEEAFQSLVDWRIKEAIDGVVVCGTTSESPTLSRKDLIELCPEASDRRVPVLAGAGSNSTDETIDFARHPERAGADAQLVVTPRYNKPIKVTRSDHESGLVADSGIHGGNLLTSPRRLKKERTTRRVFEAANEESQWTEGADPHYSRAGAPELMAERLSLRIANDVHINSRGSPIRRPVNRTDGQ